MIIPNSCLSCNGPLGTYKTEVYCINARQYNFICKDAFARYIVNFCEVLMIKGVSDITARKLIDELNLQDLYDFVVKRDQFESILGVNGSKISQEIEEKIGDITELQFIESLGIRRIGSSIVKEIFQDKIDFIELVEDISSGYFSMENDLLSIDGVGKILVDNLIEFFSKEELKTMSLNLYDHLQPVKKRIEFVDNSAIEGKKIVVTGTFILNDKVYTRKEVEQLVERYRGKVTSSVSGKTDMVVVCENPGRSKINRAKELGKQIIQMDEFLELIKLK